MAWWAHPPVVHRGAWRLCYRFVFNKRSAYWHGNEDQYDWNKGGGIGAFRRMDNMCMVAWRYVDGLFEVGPYWHPDGAAAMRRRGESGRVMPEDVGLVLPILPDEVLYVRITAVPGEPYRMLLWDTSDEHDITCEGTCCPSLSREVSAWFGGTSMPKKVVRYHRERKAEKI
ncbi:MAG: hypothetical protein D6746_05095 [Bacteroidetes bacterium]|nr:MAG: hypothetical protein D6746_05095 [Bacteroidota bacterium]